MGDPGPPGISDLGGLWWGRRSWDPRPRATVWKGISEIKQDITCTWSTGLPRDVVSPDTSRAQSATIQLPLNSNLSAAQTWAGTPAVSKDPRPSSGRAGFQNITGKPSSLPQRLSSGGKVTRPRGRAGPWGPLSPGASHGSKPWGPTSPRTPQGCSGGRGRGPDSHRQEGGGGFRPRVSCRWPGCGTGWVFTGKWRHPQTL